MREASFQVHGAKLFNSLPIYIRNLKKVSVEEFKSKLDYYLESIPDEPHLNGYVPTTCDQFSGRTQFWTMLGQTDLEGLVEKLIIGGAPSVPPFVLQKILKIVDTKY